MKRSVRIFLFPSIMTVLFFATALSPIQMLGCRTRGLLALVIALASGVAAVCTAALGLRGRIRGDSDAIKWVIITPIQTLPVIGMLILA
jgi:ABC-type transporter Mla maintaining outer membrane lipid asymmetry permease subunit MlaE